MTKDEIPNDEGMTKSESRMARCMHSRDALLARFRQSSFGIRASLGIRISFVMTHSSFTTRRDSKVALSN